MILYHDQPQFRINDGLLGSVNDVRQLVSQGRGFIWERNGVQRSVLPETLQSALETYDDYLKHPSHRLTLPVGVGVIRWEQAEPIGLEMIDDISDEYEPDAEARKIDAAYERWRDKQ